MKPRYVIGSGIPPRYVSHFFPEIHLAGGGLSEESIPFSSQSDLLQKCRSFAEQRILFSVGGHIPGPSDEMRIWQADGSMPVPFLEIVWKRPGEWIIYEIIPGTVPPWQVVELSEILEYDKNVA